MPSSEPVRLHELRQLALGELDEPARAALEQRVAADPNAARRLLELQQQLEAFERETDVASVSAAIVDRLAQPSAGRAQPSLGRPRWPRLFELAAGLAVAASVALVTVAPRFGTDVHRTRSKGGQNAELAHDERCTGACPVLEMFVKDADGVRAGIDGMTLRAGDWVQFRYRANGHRYLFIVSVDDEGVLAPLYPDRRTRSVPIDARGRHVLEGSVILDDAVGPERLYAFFSPAPLKFADIEKLLVGVHDPQRQSTLASLPPGVDQTSILIYKEAR